LDLIYFSSDKIHLLLRNLLKEEFIKYHDERKHQKVHHDHKTIANMTGVDFEVYLSKKFTEF